MLVFICTDITVLSSKISSVTSIYMVIDGEYYEFLIHPKRNRSLTPRELKRSGYTDEDFKDHMMPRYALLELERILKEYVDKHGKLTLASFKVDFDKGLLRKFFNEYHTRGIDGYFKYFNDKTLEVDFIHSNPKTYVHGMYERHRRLK